MTESSIYPDIMKFTPPSNSHPDALGPDHTSTELPPSLVTLAPQSIAVMALTADCIAVHMECQDARGVTLWEAGSLSGHTRLLALPPAEVLVRTAAIHVYLSNGPQGSVEDIYTALLNCGCVVRYSYRPGTQAHCPTHALQTVASVEYPRPTQEVTTDEQRTA